MTSGLTRRTAFQFGIAASLASAPGWAQERGRIYHLGSLFSAPRDTPHQIVLLDGLRRSGFIERARTFRLTGAATVSEPSNLTSTRLNLSERTLT